MFRDATGFVFISIYPRSIGRDIQFPSVGIKRINLTRLYSGVLW